ncbi:MAG: glycosyltransferase family 2 protein [Verrucomicrobia bacterium]|nr:glycosyltransferase family 2 protein [Verrucomicrobiota bacterium]
MKQELQELQGWHKLATGYSALPQCALIVPTFRRPAEMVRLLGVVAMLEDAPGEFLVIDGSPDDAVDRAIQDWAKDKELPFNLVYVRSPAGLTRQRNVGIDACTREFIFFLDDDCLPEPGYFESIHGVFVADTKGEVGAVRGFLTNGINKPKTLLWRLRHALRIVPQGAPGQYHHCGSSGTWDMVQPFSGNRPVDLLSGGAAAYRREVFLKHRFSEFFYGYAQGEDMEMSLRIGKEWKLLVCGDARVDHHHADSGRPAGIARGQMAVRNRYFIWRRHSPDPGAKNQFLFWMDHVLMTAYYTASFLVRPWRPYYLGFATGTTKGLIECLVSPPRHQESPARSEYAFNLRETNAAVVSAKTV